MYCKCCYTFWDCLNVLQVLLYIVGFVDFTARVAINFGTVCFYSTCCYILWDWLIVLHVLLYGLELVDSTARFAVPCGIG
jgi:hypothetical protein